MLDKFLPDGKGAAGAGELKEGQESCWYDPAADGIKAIYHHSVRGKTEFLKYRCLFDKLICLYH